MLLSRFRGTSKNRFFFRLLEVVEVALFDGQKASRNKRKASTRVLIHGEFDSVHGLPPGPRGHAELTPFLAVQASFFIEVLKYRSESIRTDQKLFS